MVVRVMLGSTFVGNDTETVYFDVADQKECDSHEFSTDILNAIFNGDFEHYFMDVDVIEHDDVDEDELYDIETCLGYNPFEKDDEEDEDE